MKKHILLAGIAVLTLTSPAMAQTTVHFVNNAGADVGTAILTENEQGVEIALDMHDVPAGTRALHFHQKAECAPADTFDHAGPHLNPFEKEHGKMSEHGPHAGDMDNIEVGKDGIIKTSILNPNVTLSAENTADKAALLDTDGSALVIHGGGDDYKTQPTGNAGARFACAEIIK